MNQIIAELVVAEENLNEGRKKATRRKKIDKIEI
jgi:hypothetical protein